MSEIKRTVCGVGYMGKGKYKSKVKGVHTPEYRCWHAMINRCYNKKRLKKFTCYSGCSVVDEWHNFQVFADWYNRTRPEGKFELDKDINSKGEKVYSPSTCSWVTKKENASYAQAKRCKLLSPDGIVFDIYDLKKFALKNNLNQGHLNRVSIGKEKQHKGWTLFEESTTA